MSYTKPYNSTSVLGSSNDPNIQDSSIQLTTKTARTIVYKGNMPDLVEPPLGNPASDGYLLQSTATGVRSWIDPSTILSGADGYLSAVNTTDLSAVSFTVSGASNITGIDFRPDWSDIQNVPADFTPASHVHDWSDITTGKPTTLAGYGITDALDTADILWEKPSAVQLKVASALSMRDEKITDLATPTSNYDAATKKYVDDSVSAAGGGDMLKCYTPDTKILTNKGWKYFYDLDVESDLVATLVDDYLQYQPIKNYFEYDIDDYIYNLETEQVSLSVTTNHKLYIQKRNSNQYELIEAKDVIGKRVKHKKDAKWVGVDKDYYIIGDYKIPFEVWVEFLGYYLSEGCTIEAKNGKGFKDYLVCVTQVKQPNKDIIFSCVEEIAKYLDKKAVINNDRNIKISSRDLYNELLKYGRSWEKYIPDYIKESTPNVINIFLDAYILGDGNISWTSNRKIACKSIFSTSYKMMEDFQELFLKVGSSGNIKVCSVVGQKHKVGDRYITSKYTCYSIILNQKSNRPQINHSGVKKQSGQIEQIIPYKGKVYSIEVEKEHILYIKRNDKPVWCGNSVYDPDNDGNVIQYWSVSGTNLSPTTVGHDILLPSLDKIQFGGSGNYIARDTADVDTLSFYADSGVRSMTIGPSGITAKVELITDVIQGTSTFLSGFAGSGWKVYKDASNDYRAEFDHLIVRKSMYIYELVINKIRATNGSLWVSDAVKVHEGILGVTNDKYFTVEENEYVFQEYDIIRAQAFNGQNVYSITYIIVSVDTANKRYYVSDYLSSDTETIDIAGYEFVRIGNLFNSERDAAIYLTASDSNSPYIAVLDNMTTPVIAASNHKVRVGNLTGLTFNGTGVGGYGLYAENAYLSGEILAISGEIGDWQLVSGNLYSTTSSGEMLLDANTLSMTISDENNILKFKVSPDNLPNLEDISSGSVISYTGVQTSPATVSHDFTATGTQTNTYYLSEYTSNSNYIDLVLSKPTTTYMFDVDANTPYSLLLYMNLDVDYTLTPEDTDETDGTTAIYSLIGNFSSTVTVRAYDINDNLLAEQVTTHSNKTSGFTNKLVFNKNVTCVDTNPSTKLYLTVYIATTNRFKELATITPYQYIINEWVPQHHLEYTAESNINVDFDYDIETFTYSGTFNQVQIGSNGLLHYKNADKYFMINEDESDYIQSAGSWSHIGSFSYTELPVVNLNDNYTLKEEDKIVTNDTASLPIVLRIPNEDVTGYHWIIMNTLNPATGNTIFIQAASGTKYVRMNGLSYTITTSGINLVITGYKTLVLYGRSSDYLHGILY